MSGRKQIRGIEETLRAINEAVRAHVIAPSRKGMIAAGLMILEEADRRCPMDLGNLAGSGFCVWNGSPVPQFNLAGGTSAATASALSASYSETQAVAAGYLGDGKTVVVIGFGAFYALYVHENVNGNVPREGGKGEHHFLSNALADKQREVALMIAGAVDGSLSGGRR